MMVSKVEFVEHSDYMVLILRIVFHEEVEKASFLLCKFVVDFSVSGNFDGYLSAGFMISGLNDLSKGTFT